LGQGSYGIDGLLKALGVLEVNIDIEHVLPFLANDWE
jgi:hypothetical protein